MTAKKKLSKKWEVDIDKMRTDQKKNRVTVRVIATDNKRFKDATSEFLAMAYREMKEREVKRNEKAS